MNSLLTVIFAGAVIALAGGVVAFSIQTQTLEASGGQSVESNVTLISAVGQPIVSLSEPSIGGEYSLRSGFLATTISDSTAEPTNLKDFWMIQ